MPSRRQFLKDASLAGAASFTIASGLSARTALPPPQVNPKDLARDESHWARVAAQYRVTEGIINLEAGYFGLMALPVLEAFHRHTDRVNTDSSYFARRAFPALFQAARQKAADFVGAKATELVLTRNATEALQALIGQYNKVGPGDVVMYADLDYNAMQWAMNGLAARRGASVARIAIPEPATQENVLETYRKALASHPRTKLLLLTHCNNKTGLILPVSAVTAMARAQGVDVVVDAAHSFGQVPLSMSALDAEFVGLNLHKWVGAPIGAGAMYIREGKLGSIDRAHADESAAETSIDTRVHTGTVNMAVMMAVPDAINFQLSVGIENKAARLRYLRDRWVNAVRGVKGVDILTPDDPHMVGAITGFRLHGRGDAASNRALTTTLLNEFRIFTHYRTGIAKGDCVRVTPALYCSAADVDKLADALTQIAARG